MHLVHLGMRFAHLHLSFAFAHPRSRRDRIWIPNLLRGNTWGRTFHFFEICPYRPFKKIQHSESSLIVLASFGEPYSLYRMIKSACFWCFGISRAIAGDVFFGFFHICPYLLFIALIPKHSENKLFLASLRIVVGGKRRNG